MDVEIRIQHADFSVAAEWESLRSRINGRTGAVASFVGLVRDRDQDTTVTGLYLEHYPGMTERSIGKIVTDAQARDWQARSAHLWAVVAPPYVLVQEQRATH